MRNKRFPNYPDDTDYTTNASSYYDDLARKEKLMRLLAERVWGYEEILDNTLEEIQERFIAWDKNLEDFPDDVKNFLQNWLDDGTLDHIINDTIFNWKLDKTIFEEFRDAMTIQMQQKSDYTTVWGLANLSQEVKESMSGGSVAVVGNNTIGDKNVINGSLPPNKLKGNIISRNKFNKATISPASMLDPTSGNIVTGNADYFVSDYIYVPANQPITFSQSSPRVFYDVEKNYIRNIPTLTFTPEVNGYVKFQAMTSLVNTSRVLYSETDTGYDDYRYKVNGLVAEVDSEKIKNASDYKGMLYGSGKLIDFDFINNEITLLPNVGLAHRNKRYLTVAQTIPIPSGNTLLMLGYEVGTGIVNLYQTGSIVPDHVIVFGAVNVVEKTVFGIDNYYINGQSSQSYKNNESNNYISEQPLTGIYKTETPLEAKGVALRDIQTTEIYNWYDGLNLTRTLEGTSPEGVPIYSYAKKVVKPPLLDPKAFELAKTPKAVIFTGTHGEHTAIYTAFKAIEQIQNNWKSDKNLEALHFNLDFVIVPCVTPFAINNNQRKNGNGVDINRNLPSGWWLNPDKASNEYGGPSALSEIEAQVVNSVLNKHKDADIVIDFHNFYLNTEIGHILWGLADKNNVLSLLNAHIGRMTREAMKVHTFIENPIGYVSPSISGTVSRHASVAYNIPRAYTFEVSESLPQDPTGQPNDSNALTLAHNSFINMLLMVLNNVMN